MRLSSAEFGLVILYSCVIQLFHIFQCFQKKSGTAATTAPLAEQPAFLCFYVSVVLYKTPSRDSKDIEMFPKLKKKLVQNVEFLVFERVKRAGEQTFNRKIRPKTFPTPCKFRFTPVKVILEIL